MDSKEKTSSSDIVDDLDLEPLNLDFDLPPIDSGELESGGEFPSLDLEPGDLDTLDLPESSDWQGEEAGEVADTSSVTPAEENEAELFAVQGEEEPVTLTADELNDIVSVDMSEAETPAEDIQVEETQAEDDFEALDLDLPEVEVEDENALPEELDLELPPVEEADVEPASEPGLEAEGLSLPGEGELDVDDSDDEVALSEDELDSILGDVDEGLDDLAVEEAAEDEEGLAEEDDSLEISDEELERAVVDEELQMPQLSILDSDDDESITLTPDELSNIVSDDLAVSPYGEGEEVLTDDLDDLEPVQEFDGFDTDTDSDSDSAISPEGSFFQDEEEGPVALTDEELADILEGTAIEEAPADEMPAEAPYEIAPPEEAAIQEAPVIEPTPDAAALDEPAAAVEEPAAQEEPRAGRMADELSLETGIKKEELKKVISYLDELLGQLPEDTVREFSRSEYFNLYKKVIEELGVFE